MIVRQGRNHAEKLRGDQGLGPNTGGRAWGECGRGSPIPRPPPAVGVREYHPPPRKIFENSDAKSFILVASALISGLPRTCITIVAVKFLVFFENYGQKVGGPIHCWSPNLKVGGPVSPGLHDCCAYVVRWYSQVLHDHVIVSKTKP